MRAVLLPGPAGPVFRAVDGGYQVVLDALVARAGCAGRAPRWWNSCATAAAGTSTTTKAPAGPPTRVILALPAPRLAALICRAGAAHCEALRRIEVASSVVVALAVPGGTPLPQNSGDAGGHRRTVARQGDHAVRTQVGVAGNAELLRLSFGRSGDTIARDTLTTRCWPGRWRTCARFSASDVEPVDVRTAELDAMPQ